MRFNSLEVCAGAGGQALGLEMAGFDHSGLVELDAHACQTLKLNRPEWQVFNEDLSVFDGSRFRGIDLLAGGLPCPPFSVAGKQLGEGDDRNLFPSAVRLVDECRPTALMIENVRGILDPRFEDFRNQLKEDLRKLGYVLTWHMFNAASFGVPQVRQRVIFVALRSEYSDSFSWPLPIFQLPRSVGATLQDLMEAEGWLGAAEWAACANDIAPTIVGGSKKHGGPDLGPTRARQTWLKLGVDGRGIADSAPAPDFLGIPRLTVRMVARIQGFPDSWEFFGRKTSAYRQVGNAFPPPVAAAVGQAISDSITAQPFLRVAVR